MESWIKTAAIIIVALVVISPFVAHAAPQLVGAEHSFIVESGSMEPAISTGSVIWVDETDLQEIEEGDVITYVADRSGQTITHRVVDKTKRDGEIYIATKGDANEERDSGNRRSENIVGEVTFVFPFLGYAIRFISSDVGTMLFVFIPVGLLVIDGIWQLYHSVERDSQEE